MLRMLRRVRRVNSVTNSHVKGKYKEVKVFETPRS